MLSALLISFLSTFFGAICGGGASLISTPLFLEIGLPVLSVLTLAKTNSTVWTFAAARNYWKRFPQSTLPLLTITACGLPFVYCGTSLARHMSPEIVKQVIGYLLIVVSLLLYFRPKFGTSERHVTDRRLPMALASIPIAFYEGFFGAGNNVLASSVLSKINGRTIQQNLGQYYVLASPWCALAAVSYLHQSELPVETLSVSLLGALAGGHYGSLVALRFSVRTVKYLAIVFGMVSGIRLIIW